MWNNAFFTGSILTLASTFLAGLSQLLLKLSAGREYTSWLREYLNARVITAYAIFVLTTVLSVAALRFIPLSLSTALAATGQVFVPLLSWLILKERITSQKAIGMVAIVVGIVIFAL